MSCTPFVARARSFSFASVMAAVALSMVSCGKDPVPVDNESSVDGFSEEARRPTAVVWILLDATRADHLSSYGYSRKTSPNIDALAQRGVVFERNYSQAPSTMMSVPSYMTGRHEPVLLQDAHHLDIWFLRKPPEEEVLVSTMFSDNGYETAMFSASPWYSERSMLGSSFDTFAWLDHSTQDEEATLEERNPELFSWLDGHAGEPFFLYVHSLDTHGPHPVNTTHDTWLDPTFPEERDRELRSWEARPYSDEDRVHIENLYDGAISYADGTVGEIVAKLEELGILDSTLVIIGSDHGELLGEDGTFLGHPAYQSYDELLHVPLIMAGPGVPAGRRVRAMTENTDIVPTLVDLFSLKTKASLDGDSLLPNMKSPAIRDPNDYVYAHTQAFFFPTEPNRILIFDDVKFDLSPYTEKGMQFLGLKGRKAVEIWAMPDSILTRREFVPPHERLSIAKREVDTVFVPLWKARDAQPKEAPGVFYLSHKKNIVPDAVVFKDDPEDDKWEHRKYGILGDPMHQDDFLVGHRWLEVPPGLVFGVDIPNGTYTVSVFCRTLDYGDGVKRGSSFKFLAMTEDSMRLFSIDPPTGDEPNTAWIEVGTYTVLDGTQFTYWIEPGNEDDFSIVGTLRFVKEGASIDDYMTAEEMRQEQERLESLGYLQ